MKVLLKEGTKINVAGVLASVLWMAINEVGMNQQVVTVINILLGILSAGVTSVLACYFGSSKGSQVKTQMLGGKWQRRSWL